MAQFIEATYINGVLEPAGSLHLEDQQRVRLIVEPIDEKDGKREAAIARFKAGVERMGLRLKAPLPSRDEPQPAAKPLVSEKLRDLRRRCAALPVLDSRTPDEILEYDERGLPGTGTSQQPETISAEPVDSDNPPWTEDMLGAAVVHKALTKY